MQSGTLVRRLLKRILGQTDGKVGAKPKTAVPLGALRQPDFTFSYGSPGHQLVPVQGTKVSHTSLMVSHGKSEFLSSAFC